MADRGKRLGLVLSGGGIRGAAHIGVLRVLEDAGLRPDLIVGTSIGAAAGAAYAAGYSPDAMRSLIRYVRWPRITELSLRNRLAILKSTPMDDFLKRAIEPRRFEDLDLPFAAVATDIATGEMVILATGSVAEAVRASSALPGYFPPVLRDGRILVDGGVVANLPVDAARTLGADVVVAVDVMPPPAGKRPPKNPIDMILLTSNIRCRLTHPAPESVDCYVMPDVADLGWSKVSDVPELVRRGEAAMERELPKLRRALGR